MLSLEILKYGVIVLQKYGVIVRRKIIRAMVVVATRGRRTHQTLTSLLVRALSDERFGRCGCKAAWPLRNRF